MKQWITLILATALALPAWAGQFKTIKDDWEKLVKNVAIKINNFDQEKFFQQKI